MKKISLFIAFVLLTLASCSEKPQSFQLGEGQSMQLGHLTKGKDWIVKGKVFFSEGAQGRLFLKNDDGSDGYCIVLNNGQIDGSIKTGSLLSVRNLYRSLTSDGEWTDLEFDISGQNIQILVGGEVVVNYTEPEQPFRLPEKSGMKLSDAVLIAYCTSGNLEFSDFTIEEGSAAQSCEIFPDLNTAEITVNPRWPAPALDEQADRIIRFQQEDFPVIDYHVHLKGGLTKEQAHMKSLCYGINYGVAPNAGEGGVGRMLSDDSEVYAYFEEVKDFPFLRGVQGEGRKWPMVFSQQALGIFDYLFTDAMTIVDQKGRIARIYRPEEVILDGCTKDEYMRHIVEQTVKILTNEPADIYANATYIPDDMNPDYDKYWTPSRVDRVLQVLKDNGIALEISARYRIPSFAVIKKAKEMGLKFTFGTNNVDPDFGKLDYCLDAVSECGITADDIWFPSMSVRSSRPVILYNEQLMNK